MQEPRVWVREPCPYSASSSLQDCLPFLKYWGLWEAFFLPAVSYKASVSIWTLRPIWSICDPACLYRVAPLLLVLCHLSCPEQQFEASKVIYKAVLLKIHIADVCWCFSPPIFKKCIVLKTAGQGWGGNNCICPKSLKGFFFSLLQKKAKHFLVLNQLLIKNQNWYWENNLMFFSFFFFKRKKIQLKTFCSKNIFTWKADFVM